MPTSSTRPTTPGPSNLARTGSKRQMSDADVAAKGPKKQRVDVAPPNDHPKRDSNRDAKRRRKKKKKAPIVSTGGARVTIKNDTLTDGLSHRAPLSSRNEIIRFNSVAPVSSGAAGLSIQRPSTVPIEDGRSGSQQPTDNVDAGSAREISPSSPKQKTKSSPPHSTSLEDKVAQLTQELVVQNELNAAHQRLLNQIHQAVTCQICLDLMYKPYALAPCGHLACYNCLVQWFTAPPPNNGPVLPPIMRKKTCPHCRTVVRERPIEVWGVKGIVQSVSKSGLVPIPVLPPVDPTDNARANADPWSDIFPKAGSGHRRFPWFFPGVDDDNLPAGDLAPRGEDVGMLDMEDGGIYRCLDCMHEIWDGVCTSCARVYPGHRQHEDEDDEDEIGWIDDQMGAEEVDMADDPGWMGLEGGDGDDDGMDNDDFDPYGPPWQYRMQMVGAPFGFFGIEIGDDDEDEGDGDSDTSDSEREGSEDEGDGYESSFIDDEDSVGVPRIYEIPDNSGLADFPPDERSSDVETHSDGDDVEVSWMPEPSRSTRSRAVVVVSSDEDDSASDAPCRRPRRTSRRSLRGASGRAGVGSDDSEVEVVSDEN